jgi:hypothetical protein
MVPMNESMHSVGFIKAISILLLIRDARLAALCPLFLNYRLKREHCKAQKDHIKGNNQT